MSRIFPIILMLALPWSASAQAPENTGPNINIERWAKGSYTYRTLEGPEEDRRIRGWERFEFMAYRDGTRSLTITQNLAARNAQFSVMLSVDEQFRPIYAFVDYWTENGHKGTALMQVDGDDMHIVSSGVMGTLRSEDDIEGPFSIGTHPVSADGWHRPALSGETDDGSAFSGRAYHLEASSDLKKPIIGYWEEFSFTETAQETITVPAGTFDTTRYTISDLLTVWVTGEDNLLVRMISERFDREYLLDEFEQGGRWED